MDTTYLTMLDEGLYDLLSDSIEFSITEPMAIFSITKDYVARPDKVSLLFYATDEYWWAICRANNLRYSFKASLTLRRSKYDAFDKNIVTDLYYDRSIIIPTLDDINTHLNTIKGA
ncbi:MAG: hypothetical protein M0R17_00545 [Candidatus Omnitrophica bacterium]|jgi:hypothetical protein|nr:hypothetical protein [Candidatus Omnitrophota bacterium]